MILKILLLVATVSLISNNSCSQGVEDPLSPISLIRTPEVLPPSPNAASLGKYGGVPLNLSTGKPNVNIPLFEINTQNLTLPLSLSYTTDGFRVDELASRVGLGWALNSGGVITRTVNDGIDEISTVPTIPSGFQSGADNQTILDFLESAQQGQFDDVDMQPDIFSFNFAGYTGQFIIVNSKVVFLTHSNLDIETELLTGQPINGFSFRITAPDGVVYYFGGAAGYETSASESFGMNCGGYKDFNQATTAWYLRRMVHPKNDSIDFYYSGVSLSYKLSISQSQSRRGRLSELGPSCGDIEELLPPPATDATCIMRIQNFGIRLDSIVTSGYAKVSFNYIGRPDLIGDYLVKDILLTNKLTTAQIKTFSLNYDSVTANLFTNSWNSTDNELKKRIFLKSLADTSQAAGESRIYRFEYNNIDSLPARLAFARDHWGYFNGQNNQNLLFLEDQDINNLTSLYTLFNGDAVKTPDINYAKRGLLSKIIYPTGGNDQLEYELNTYQETIGGDTINYETGGVRVKRISTYDPLAQIGSVKRYYYSYLNDLAHSSATKTLVPDIEYLMMTTYASFSCNMCDFARATYYNLGVNSRFPLSLFNGSLITYPAVIESHGENFENGGTEYHFEVEKNYAGTSLYGGQYIIFPSIGNDLNGKPIYENRFTKQGSSLLSVKEITTDYLTDNRIDSLFFGYVIRKNFQIVCYESGATLGSFTINNSGILPYDVIKYDIPQKWNYIEKQTTNERVPGTAQTIQKEINYSHYTIKNLQPNIISSKTSEGEDIKIKIQYNDDYTSGSLPLWMQNLNSQKIKNVPIETLRIKKINGSEYLIGGTLNIYYDNAPNIKYIYQLELNSPLLLSSFDSSRVNTGAAFTFDSRYKLAVEFISYDDFGNILSQRKADDVKNCYIWDYKQSYPIAQIINGSENNFTYTSFESDGKGSWLFSGATDNTYSITGGRSYQTSGGSITRSGLTSDTYIISYWGKGGSITVNSAGPTRTGETIEDWTYYEHEITGTSVTVSGSRYIDELRLYPKGAQMTTYTYAPLIGMTSLCDINNEIAYYEYDGLNRLVLIRDQDKNIIRKICYNYAGQPEDCMINTNPDWQNTGNLRCVTSGGVNTGYQEREEKDMNPYSGTYNQTQWVSNGQNLTACPLPIYAKIFVTDIYNDFEETTATITIKFFSNAACTTPVSVSNLNVNYKEVRTNCGGGGTTITNSYSINCNGTQTSLGTQTISWDDGIHCWDYTFSVTAGTGYQLGN